MNFDENQITNTNDINMVPPGAELQNQQEALNLINQTTEQNPCMQTAKENLAQEIQTIDYLLQKGMLNPQQGLKLLCERVNIAKQQCLQDTNADKNSLLDSAEFFKNADYKHVLDYLKSTNADFEAGDISQITDLIKLIEQNAIERYLRNKNYEQKKVLENEQAKRRLSTVGVKNESAEYSTPVFTREAIGKMSSTEFVKNEKAIMNQLKRGLIR